MRRGLVLIFIFSFIPIWGEAQSPKTKVEIKRKAKDLEKVKSELSEKNREKEELEKKASEIQEEVQQKQKVIFEVEKSLLNTMKRQREVQETLASTKNKFDNLSHDLSQAEIQIKKSLQLCYVATQLNGPTALPSVYTRQLFRHHLTSKKELTQEKEEKYKKLNELTDTYQVFRGELKTQKSSLSGLKTKQEVEQKRLEKLKSRREILEQELTELNQASEELASLIDILRTQAKKEKTTTAEKQRKLGRGATPISKHTLIWPIEGKVVRSFGRQKHPELGTPFISNGILIRDYQRQPVKGVSDGTVLFAGRFMNYGFMVVVEHENDWYSVYGHLTDQAVEKGQKIQRGNVLGWTEPTADGGQESYFELRFSGKPVNPVPYLANR